MLCRYLCIVTDRKKALAKTTNNSEFDSYESMDYLTDSNRNQINWRVLITHEWSLLMDVIMVFTIYEWLSLFVYHFCMLSRHFTTNNH